MEFAANGTRPVFAWRSPRVQSLEFEEAINELEAKIEELRNVGGSEIDLQEEIKRLQKNCEERIRTVYSSLTPWQTTQVARHPRRPHSLDYIHCLCENFVELHGDRMYGDDPAIVGGPACLRGHSVMIIGHQKGRNTQDNLERNFGMPQPEGYRKALRLMRLAERFSLPLLTFIDTPGAYPGVGAEQRNQSCAIAENLIAMSELRIPIIATIIGEGGSGGALAIGVGDRTLIFQYGVYSVISPEGCAEILWKDVSKAPQAAEAMRLTAPQLYKEELVDRVIPEPLGGAHRDPQAAATELGRALEESLLELKGIDLDTLVRLRRQRLLSYGGTAAARMGEW